MQKVLTASPSQVAADHLTQVDVAARAVDVTKIYGNGKGQITALLNVAAQFRRAEFSAVMGPSGAGKSTLVRALSGLEPPSIGSVYLGEIEVSRLPEAQRLRVCRDRVTVLGGPPVIDPNLSVGENVALSAATAGHNVSAAWFSLVVDAVGLGGDVDRYPTSVSGGQAMRIELARALLGRPQVVVADDPIGGLDPRATLEMLDALRHTVDVLRQTVVMVASKPIAAAYADQVLFLYGGRLVDQTRSPSSARVLERMKRLGATRTT